MVEEDGVTGEFWIHESSGSEVMVGSARDGRPNGCDMT